MAMRAALGDLMQKYQAPPQTNTLGTGTPPVFPGSPPPPEMVGAMPVGSKSTTAKAAADAAITQLRDAKGYFPNLGNEIENMIDQLKAACQQPEPAPPPVGNPGGPGSAVTDTDPLMDSGSPGTV